MARKNDKTATKATETVDLDARRKAAGAKAAATKGEVGHKMAGLRARITRLERLRDALTGYDKGLVTKELTPLYAKLEAFESGATVAEVAAA